MDRTGLLDGSAVVERLDAEVRDEVRRSGVDPLVDVETVRRFARTAVAEHDQRSLSGSVRPVADRDAMVEELVARVAGFGPLQRYLDDPKVATGI
jgi:pilus assembly protein CpaF